MEALLLFVLKISFSGLALSAPSSRSMRRSLPTKPATPESPRPVRGSRHPPPEHRHQIPATRALPAVQSLSVRLLPPSLLQPGYAPPAHKFPFASPFAPCKQLHSTRLTRAVIPLTCQRNLSLIRAGIKSGNHRGRISRLLPRQPTAKAGHRKLTAHETARYRCFLPDLAGLAGFRRVRPMSDQFRYYHVTFSPSFAPRKTPSPPPLQARRSSILETSCQRPLHPARSRPARPRRSSAFSRPRCFYSSSPDSQPWPPPASSISSASCFVLAALFLRAYLPPARPSILHSPPHHLLACSHLLPALYRRFLLLLRARLRHSRRSPRPVRNVRQALQRGAGSRLHLPGGAFVSHGPVGGHPHRGFGFPRRLRPVHRPGRLLLHGHGDAPLRARGLQLRVPCLFPACAPAAARSLPCSGSPASLARTTAVMVAAILAAAVILFFAMPRISGGYLSRYAQSDTISTGFSESVNLGEIGRIQQSSEVVAHIHIDGDTTGDRQIRLRGAVLTIFDGKRWTNPHQRRRLPRPELWPCLPALRPRHSARPPRRASPGPRTAARSSPLPRPHGAAQHQRHLHHSRRPGSVRSLSRDRRRRRPDLPQPRPRAHRHPLRRRLRRLRFRHPPPSSASATLCRLPFPTATSSFPSTSIRASRSSPIRSPAPRPSPYRRALAIERYLTTHYGYTLQLPSQPPADPLADFLFHRRRGHCEYFASSMAVLLRTVGIPSRIITGFRGAQFNQLNSTYIVRASDAHSWVEAYIPGAGWTAFDPTPAGNAPVANLWSRSQLYLDAAREFWREWIVNYDAAHQQALSVAGVRQTRHGITTSAAGRRPATSACSTAPAGFIGRHPDPQRLLRPALILLIAAPAHRPAHGGLRLRRRWRAASPLISPLSAAAIFYLRMVRRLARKGYRRSPAQTPAEFAASITDPALREAVLRFNRPTSAPASAAPRPPPPSFQPCSSSFAKPSPIPEPPVVPRPARRSCAANLESDPAPSHRLCGHHRFSFHQRSCSPPVRERMQAQHQRATAAVHPPGLHPHFSNYHSPDLKSDRRFPYPKNSLFFRLQLRPQSPVHPIG